MISINIILDVFSEYELTVNIRPELKFKRVCFVPFQTRELSSSNLYLCSLKDAAELQNKYENCYFLCTDDTEIAPVCNCAVVHGIFDLVQLASIAQERFTWAMDWVEEMNKLVSAKAPYQDFIDLAEYKLNNSIYILDGALNLVANTKTIQDDAEQNVQLRRHGYHLDCFIDKLRVSGRIAKIQTQAGPIYSQNREVNKYDTISRWIFDAGMPALCTIMVCSKTSFNECQADLFELLTSHVGERFRISTSDSIGASRYYEELFKDMLFRDLKNVHSIAERAKLAGIPMKGTFEICTVILNHNESYPAMRLAKEFAELLPQTRIIIEEYQIVMLNCYPDTSAEELKTRRCQMAESIGSLLLKRDAMCGISEIFNDFCDLQIAYTQALRSVSSGEALSDFQPAWKQLACPDNAAINWMQHPSVFYYEDIYVYYMLDRGRTNPFDIYRNTPTVRKIGKMLRDDKRQATDNAKILYTYLVCERNASKAGDVLHMHRNNVIYRIHRIEDRLGVDLGDYWTRLKILLAFHLLEIENAFKLQSSNDTEEK